MTSDKVPYLAQPYFPTLNKEAKNSPLQSPQGCWMGKIPSKYEFALCVQMGPVTTMVDALNRNSVSRLTWFKCARR